MVVITFHPANQTAILACIRLGMSALVGLCETCVHVLASLATVVPIKAGAALDREKVEFLEGFTLRAKLLKHVYVSGKNNNLAEEHVVRGEIFRRHAAHLGVILPCKKKAPFRGKLRPSFGTAYTLSDVGGV